ARAGWGVTVHEAADTVGGGVRSEELTLPGFVHDVCSAIHPLGRDSPFFRDLELPVDWVHPDVPAAHPLDDGTAVTTERSLLATGHVSGWGLPRGGWRGLADALADRLEELGGEIRTESPVDELPRADVVLADVVPRELLRMAGGKLPGRYARALRRYRHGPGVFKLDWALDSPIPWTADDCRRAATVHAGGTFEAIAESEQSPGAARPFV